MYRFRLSETYLLTDIRSETTRLPSCLTTLFNKIAHAISGAKEVDFGQRSKAGGAVVSEKWRMELVFRRERLEPDSSPLLQRMQVPITLFSAQLIRDRAAAASFCSADCVLIAAPVGQQERDSRETACIIQQ